MKTNMLESLLYAFKEAEVYSMQRPVALISSADFIKLLSEIEYSLPINVHELLVFGVLVKYSTLMSIGDGIIYDDVLWKR